MTEVLPVDTGDGEIIPPLPVNGDAIPYERAVEICRAAVSGINKRLWLIGEIAGRLEPRYGDETLQKFADEIGAAYSTLRACIATVRAWPDKVTRVTFSVCHALNSHPDRVRLLERWPNMSKRQAEEQTRLWRDPALAAEQELEEITEEITQVAAEDEEDTAVDVDPDVDQDPGDSPEVIFRRGLLFRAAEAACGAGFEDTWKNFTIDKPLVDAAEKAGEAWMKLAAFLKTNQK